MEVFKREQWRGDWKGGPAQPFPKGDAVEGGDDREDMAKASSSESPECAMAVTPLGNARQLCTGCSWGHGSEMSSCGCGQRLVPCDMSSKTLSQLFNCGTNGYFLWLNTLSLDYPSEKPAGSNEVIIFKSTDEETKHKDKQYFQEFGTNLSGIFPWLRIHV